MIIAEFTIDHPILREPLNTVPDITMEWGQTYEQPDGSTQILVWITSDDFTAVETAIESDPGVTSPTVLTDLGDRRLYQVGFAPRSYETDLLPQLVAVGGLLQTAIGTNDGWKLRVRFPNREAFERIYQFCRDHDLDFTFHRIFERGTRSQGDGPMLTDAQQEILFEAVDSGYLAIPRECSLAELGARLGISQTAASERFRRAVRNLIEQNRSP